ncbi:rod shape-determining protein MreC [Streptococcus equinus]|uniref:rod shape-determining protein MreC n=1 Tax=Streptococcus equinus TaxID=1335 RepID=UPI00042125FA|nr:rod shape-determining protein MreC [Streptococcus equinus]QGX46149.1 rod shape-determining protein MreC [Streptococcus equinus]SCW54101.1 rod shape-determining protein MreC [Streptococcus equinus]SEK77841.1 rod shape-determining protein MreC [Streptococcus equinus]
MKKLRISRFVFFAVVILLLLSFSLSLLFRNLGVISVVSSPIRSVVARVDSVVSAPFRSLGSLNEDIHDLFSTYSENKKLKKKVAELENQSEEIASLKTENEQLNNTINASSSIATQFSATGKVIVRSPVSWYESLTVKIGKDKNVAKKMLALSNGGLIGVVDDVDSSTSNIALLANGSDFSIPVKISTASGDLYGILESFDSEKKCFVVSNLNSSTDVVEGDSVVTSGLDGDTVANVSVGSVSSVKNSSENLERVVYVKPTADFSDISYVTVVGD